MSEVNTQVRGYILAALGLIVGLAWNDAVKSFIEYIFPINGNSIFAKFLYALALTIVVIIVSRYFITKDAK